MERGIEIERENISNIQYSFGYPVSVRGRNIAEIGLKLISIVITYGDICACMRKFSK